MFSKLFGKPAARKVFIFRGQETQMPPKHFAYWSVRWVIDGIPDCIKYFSKVSDGGNKDTLQNMISKSPVLAEYYLIAYSLAAYYVYSATVLNVPKDILGEMFIGYKDGISEISHDGTPILPQHVQAILGALIRYAQAIDSELGEAPPSTGEIKFDSGLSAALVYQDIVEGYDPDSTLDIQPLDEMLMQKIIAENGIPCMVSLKNDLGIGYIP